MPGLYHFQGIDRIKMADDYNVKKETAGKAEGIELLLLPVRYT